MATKTLKVTNTWMKVSSGEAVVLQNRGENNIEVATAKAGDLPNAGFMLNDFETFNYPGGDEVWVKCKGEASYIAIDNIGM